MNDDARFDDITAAERQEFVEALRQLERQNETMRRALACIADCHKCDLCAESARLVLEMVRDE